MSKAKTLSKDKLTTANKENPAQGSSPIPEHDEQDAAPRRDEQVPDEAQPLVIVNSENYQIQQKIGQGGMGQVYLALDTRLQRTVAIKVLTPDAVATDSKQINHFEQALAEARLLAKLNHPNIVQIYDVIVSAHAADNGKASTNSPLPPVNKQQHKQQQIALVMEYLSGKTLQQFQHQHVTTLIQKLQILKQIALGLGAAHDNGIVHCDLKASNILIDIDNRPQQTSRQGHAAHIPHAASNASEPLATRVKIIDFGIAQVNTFTDAEKRDKDKSLTQPLSQSSNTSYGSWSAMSPEQLAPKSAGQVIDFRSDLFSLGIIAFNFLAGRHPFHTGMSSGINAGSAIQTAQAIIDNQVSDAKDIIPQLPTPLATLLNQLLAHQVQDRPVSSHKVAERLQQIIVALTQQEILAEQTLPVGEDGMLLTPSPLTLDTGKSAEETLSTANKANKANTTTTTTTTTTTITSAPLETSLNKKKQRITLFSVLALGLIFLVNTFINQDVFAPTPAKIRHIAVLPPTLSANSNIAAIQRDLVVATIDDAIRQSIINTKQLRLISRAEVSAISKESDANISLIGNATGATDIITTELNCNNVRCNVILSRISSGQKDGEQTKGNSEKKWTVFSQQSWPTQLEHFNDIYNDSQTHFLSTFPNFAETVLTFHAIDEQDYLQYIELYAQIQFQGQYSDDTLNRLKQVIVNSPYLYSAYTLFRKTALMLYNETKDTKYSSQLNQLMLDAPPEYKYSVFQSIDAFVIALALNKIDEAKQQLDSAIKRGVDGSTLTELQAAFSWTNNELPLAVQHYQTALLLRPSTKLYYNLALSYYYLGDLTSAKKALQQLLAITPAKYNANQLLAGIYLLEGNLKLAISSYEKVVKSNPKSNDLANLGLAYSLAGRYQDALNMAQLAVDKSPNNPNWLLNLADAELILGLTQQANLHYQQVIDLHQGETDLVAQMDFTQAYVHLEDNSAAIKALNQAKKLAPNNGEVAFAAALVYTLAGQQLSALSQVEEALGGDIGAVWFNLPWFDELCSSEHFNQLMIKAGNVKRCQH